MEDRVRPMSAAEAHVPRPGEAFRHGRRRGACTCFIIPQRVLERFAADKKLTAEQRKYFVDAAKLEHQRVECHRQEPMGSECTGTLGKFLQNESRSVVLLDPKQHGSRALHELPRGEQIISFAAFERDEHCVGDSARFLRQRLADLKRHSKCRLELCRVLLREA